MAICMVSPVSECTGSSKPPIAGYVAAEKNKPTNTNTTFSARSRSISHPSLKADDRPCECNGVLQQLSLNCFWNRARRSLCFRRLGGGFELRERLFCILVFRVQRQRLLIVLLCVLDIARLEITFGEAVPNSPRIRELSGIQIE